MHVTRERVPLRMKRDRLTDTALLQERLAAGVRSLVQAGVPTEASTLGEPLSPERLFAGSERECLRELWAHYRCERLLADLADAALLELRPGTARHVWGVAPAPERCRLQDAFAVYLGRNAMLRALRARTTFRGDLHIHLIEASGLLAVDQLRYPRCPSSL